MSYFILALLQNIQNMIFTYIYDFLVVQCERRYT